MNPFRRCCIRVMHLLRFHFGLSIVYALLFIAVIMSFLVALALSLASSALDSLVDAASASICSRQQANVFTNTATCRRAFNLLEAITHTMLMDHDTCTDRVMLLCSQNQLHMLLMTTSVSTLLAALLAPSQWYLVGHLIQKNFMHVLDTIMCMGQ